jgi:hypothetical protein
MLSLFREYDQYNNYFQQVMGIYMYASGLPQQAFAVLSHLGASVSYSSLAQTNPWPLIPSTSDVPSSTESELERPKRCCGLLVELSKSCCSTARKEAEDGLFGTTYDNVNFLARVGKQRIGHKGEMSPG